LFSSPVLFFVIYCSLHPECRKAHRICSRCYFYAITHPDDALDRISDDMRNAVCLFGSKLARQAMLEKKPVDGNLILLTMSPKGRKVKVSTNGKAVKTSTQLIAALDNQLSLSVPAINLLEVDNSEAEEKKLTPQSKERKRIEESSHLMVSCGCGDVFLCIAQQTAPRRMPRMTQCANWRSCGVLLEEGCHARSNYCYRCRTRGPVSDLTNADPYPSVNKGIYFTVWFVSHSDTFVRKSMG
jgi:hypothetical protein